ncbi:MAG: hypothetical protein LBG52_05010 [Candidatus Peribacteria bacterium]|jgi:RNA polymerase subunit RPABC4/transcription elongation factor Spt4|nr:hypothetical protein [Candidatus Peribacteria bacterium]
MPLTDPLQEALTELSGTVSTVASLDTNLLNTIWEQMTGLTNIRIALGGIFCFFWIVTLIRVIKDSNARSEHLGLQVFAVMMVIILTPIFGLPLYIACRPQGRKRDKSNRRTALLATLQTCPNCRALNPIDHTCCTMCGDVLHQTCRECGESYSRSYDYCPICGAPNIEK